MKEDSMARVKCPRCLRDFVRPLSSAGPLETLLSAFRVYPFKCQLCGHRFRSLQWGIGDNRNRLDRRQYTRLKRKFPITFSGEGIAGDGTLVDISMAGCGFTTGTDLPTGMVMRVRLQIADDIPAVAVDAAVVRHTRQRAHGVEFIQWQERERERLQIFVRGMLIKHGVEAE